MDVLSKTWSPKTRRESGVARLYENALYCWRLVSHVAERVWEVCGCDAEKRSLKNGVEKIFNG
jgi:hypothetical protein